MQNDLPYTSSVKDMPFMFSEMKRTAMLLCDGLSGDDIIRQSLDKNIYQLEKEKRRRDVPLRMIKRLGTIGQPLIEIIATGRDEEARLVAFLAFIKADRLLFEYMREVYTDIFNAGHIEIHDKDFLDFIERKAQNNDVVEKWSTDTLTNIRGKIKSSLCDAGLAKRIKVGLLIQKPIVTKEFLQMICDNEKDYAKVMLMEV